MDIIREKPETASELIDFYRSDLNARLFPLKKRPIGDKKAKSPLVDKWQERKYREKTLKKFAADGHALGWALEAGDLVIDVDAATPERPGKKGLESYEKLLDLVGSEGRKAIEGSLRVGSPSGGFHIYMTKQADVAIRKTVDELPDIEFFSAGGYVVIAGSPHWQGGNYELAADSASRQDAPEELVELIRKPISESSEEPGECSPEALKVVLSELDVTQYREHDDWLKLLMASHSATGGSDEGRDVFIEWSTGDPNFAEAGAEIAKRWDSLDEAKRGGITIATLFDELNESGRGDVAKAVQAKLEFQNVPMPTAIENAKPDKKHERNFNSLREAKALIESLSLDGVPTVRRFQGVWYQWEEGFYSPMGVRSEEAFRNRAVIPFLNERFIRVKSVMWNETIAQASALCDVPERSSLPIHTGKEPIDLEDCLLLRDRIVPLADAASDRGKTYPATANVFNTSRIDVSFADFRKASSPELWLSFLADVIGDEESIETLQKWFGYCLTNATDQQKMLWLIGPPRSGKGTISSILTALLDERNVAGTGTDKLISPFGRQSFVDKSLITLNDARISFGRAQSMAVEFILNVTGEDRISIERKHLPDWEGQLKAKLLLMANEIPRISDNSTAIAERVILIETPNSFLGREDLKLKSKLKAELPAILGWAVEGWRKLQQSPLRQPEGGAQRIQELRFLSSPIKQFVEDCCELDPEAETPRKELFRAYQFWAKEEGKSRPTDKSGFSRDLRSAFGKQIGDSRPTIDGTRVWCFTGIKVLPPNEDELIGF